MQREGRRRIDVNHISQLESFIYLSGSGFPIRIPDPFSIPDSGFWILDSRFLLFHTSKSETEAMESGCLSFTPCSRASIILHNFVARKVNSKSIFASRVEEEPKVAHVLLAFGIFSA